MSWYYYYHYDTDIDDMIKKFSALFPLSSFPFPFSSLLSPIASLLSPLSLLSSALDTSCLLLVEKERREKREESIEDTTMKVRKVKNHLTEEDKYKSMYATGKIISQENRSITNRVFIYMI